MAALSSQVLSPYLMGYRGVGALVPEHRCRQCSSSRESAERSAEAVRGVKEHCGTLQLWLVVFYYSSSAYYSIVGRILWSVVTGTAEVPGPFQIGAYYVGACNPARRSSVTLAPSALPE